MEFPAAGRTADVYAIDAHTVLRRYRSGGDVEREAAFMRHVAAHGYPVPQVYDAGGPDIRMQRLNGPTMRTALLAGEADLESSGRLLADLGHRLHEIPPLDADDGCVIHLDLHPDNVVLTADGPMVIDWCNARNGPAALDLGMTAVILAQVVVGIRELAEPVRVLLQHFLAAAPNAGDLLDAAVARRASDPAMTPAELEQIGEAEALIRQLIASVAAHPD